MTRAANSKLLIRLLLLIFTITVLSLLILTKCGVGDLSNEYYQTSKEIGNYDSSEAQHLLPNTEPIRPAWSTKFQMREKSLQQNIKNLTQQIHLLQTEIMKMKISLHKAEDQLSISTTTSKDYMYGSNMLSSYHDCTNYIRKQVGAAEVLHGLPLNNEYEIVPFNHFTFTRLYPIELGLGKRVVEKPIGYKRKDILEAINKAVDSINRNITTRVQALGIVDNAARFMLDDFIEGIYRHEATTGTQYELYFRNKQTIKVKKKNNNLSMENTSDADNNYQLSSVTNNAGTNGVIKVIVMRPFAPLQTIQMTAKTKVGNARELIHVILPLSGRLSTFRGFMEKFVKIALRHDKRVQLTVVYFGEEGLSEARNIMSRVMASKSSGATADKLRLLALNESFSRAKGLRMGAEQLWKANKTSKESDVLLFMCDVDIVFSAKFLDRCRWNTEPGRKVYYPVVFSLYNPHVIYTMQGRDMPSESDQLQISRETGFWRDFGYGMTCQYRSDFLKVRGFDEEIIGWGGEDVMLYRKYIRSKIKIIRATDPGIFHIWHPKVCSGTSNAERLTADQYRACIRSRALNEASHAQLGFLAFREDIAAQNQIHLQNNKSHRTNIKSF